MKIELNKKELKEGKDYTLKGKLLTLHIPYTKKDNFRITYKLSIK